MPFGMVSGVESQRCLFVVALSYRMTSRGCVGARWAAVLRSRGARTHIGPLVPEVLSQQGFSSTLQCTSSEALWSPLCPCHSVNRGHILKFVEVSSAFGMDDSLLARLPASRFRETFLHKVWRSACSTLLSRQGESSSGHQLGHPACISPLRRRAPEP